MKTFVHASRCSSALFRYLLPLRIITNIPGVQATDIKSRLVLTRL